MLKVKVVTVDKADVSLGIQVGDVYEVTGVDQDGDYYIDPMPIPELNHTMYNLNVRVLLKSQVEVINDEQPKS